MVDMGILSNNMKCPSPNSYMIFWSMTICSYTTRTRELVTELDLITDFAPNYHILRGFHLTFATGAASKQMTLSPTDPWSCPIRGLHVF